MSCEMRIIAWRLVAVCAAAGMICGCKDAPSTPAPSVGATKQTAEGVGGGASSDSTGKGAVPGGAANAGSEASRGVVGGVDGNHAGVDSADDPPAAGTFPKSGEIAGLVKREAARRLEAGRLAEVVGAEAAGRLALFRIGGISVAGYSEAGGEGTGEGDVIRIAVIEAGSVEDAYGLMSCQSGSKVRLAIGGETRAERDGGLVYVSRQGRCCVRAWSGRADEASAAAMEKLLRFVVGRIEGQGGPKLLEAMPEGEGRVVFLVRSPRSVPVGALGTASRMDWAVVENLLGMNEGRWMCIGAYDVKETGGVNVVWVAEYGSGEQAQMAKSRYLDYMAAGADRAMQGSNLLAPRGRHLIGTWTEEEESVQYLMPLIEERLGE